MTASQLLSKINFDKKNLTGLVCPECAAPLSFEAEELTCGHCSKIYPVQNGVPCFVELDPSSLPFKEEYFDFWFNRENVHFWHVARREIIFEFTKSFLKGHFGFLKNVSGIEIGIGNGNVAQQFIQGGVSMQGADLFYSSLMYCRKRMDIPLYQADLLKLPFKEKFDFVGIYDIIEHIENDRLAIRNLYRSLKPGGLLNVTVPACKAMWSKFDELDHKRRYEKQELVEKLEEAGFEVLRASYFMSLLFPVVFIVRKIQKYPKDTKLEHVKEVRIVPVVNEIFLALFRLEKYLLKMLNFPMGSSLIAVARKPLGKE